MTFLLMSGQGLGVHPRGEGRDGGTEDGGDGGRGERRGDGGREKKRAIPVEIPGYDCAELIFEAWRTH